MTNSADISIDSATTLADVDPSDWDACAIGNTGQRPQDPFTTYRFLKALEDSGSVGSGTGWTPNYLLARTSGEIVGVAPLYIKLHSQGEYIFDHAIADAYLRAGGRYFPKLQIAVPFTPATGRRFLVKDPNDTQTIKALMTGAMQIAHEAGLSSLHVTFCTSDEQKIGAQMGFLPRLSQQFHWLNDGYSDFGDFLSNLSSRKRKNIRKERETAHNFGGDILALTGDDIQPDHWNAFWEFYQDTGARKWGTPYLTRAFFDHAHENLRDDMLLVLAVKDGKPVAGALNFIGSDTLYGRYWGCTEDHPCLHFELCYYRAIDYAIAHGLNKVEAGAQGAHKLARGYLPVETHSMHYFPNEGFSKAVETYFDAEKEAVGEEIDILTQYGPFKDRS
ncbi:MAG: GNAT family N-acetyltransferase [Planktomarina sp.]